MIFEHGLHAKFGFASLPVGAPLQSGDRQAAGAGRAAGAVGGNVAGRKEVAWQKFVRQRSGGRAAKAGYGFRIEFLQGVQGPVAVGYRAHVVMGMSMSGDKFGIGADHGS